MTFRLRDVSDPFLGCRRAMRRDDPWWYVRCRARSFAERLAEWCSTMNPTFGYAWLDVAADRDPVRQRTVIAAFLAASRNGDFEALIALLHPDVVMQADRTAVGMGSLQTTVGATSVAAMFSGRALTARPALIDGMVGIVWAIDGRPKVIWVFTVQDDEVVSIDMIADHRYIASLNVVELP